MNQATMLYAVATDMAGNLSACTLITTFVNDGLAPATATFATIDTDVTSG